MNADYKFGYVGLTVEETEKFKRDMDFREIVLLAAHNVSLWKEKENEYRAIDRYSDPFAVTVMGHRKGLLGLNPVVVLGHYTVLNNKGWEGATND